MLDCTTDNYESLYARWLVKPSALLLWGGYDPKQHTLLDLCGGTGAVSRAAIAMGGSATLLDLNPRCSDPGLVTLKGRAEDLGHPYLWSNNRSLWRSWNFVVCRQALGYLDLNETAKAVHKATAPGTLFVCNAFVKPKWSFQSYQFCGRKYIEASGYFGRRVFHLQAMREDFDVTAFRWHTEEEIRSAFAPRWMLEKIDVTDKSMKFAYRRLA